MHFKWDSMPTVEMTMSARRETPNRMTLFRECAVCGRSIVTTADTPWMRLVTTQEDGKRRQKVKYYCSGKCKAESYIHRFDGKAEQRRAQREQARDISTKNRRYYAAHREQEKARQKERYWANLEASRLAVQFNHQKRRALGLE